MSLLYAAKKTIEVGHHPTFVLFGLKFDADIMASTTVAVIIFLFLGLRMSRRASAGVPSKLQYIYEYIVYELVGETAESAIGPKYQRFVPIGVTLFLFIWICNWMSIIPSALSPGISFELLPPPTSDVNLPLAMALLVIVWVHIESVKARGFKGYVKHYFQPFGWLAPINLIEEITKPITLTFRLFGNLFSGGLMILVVTVLIPAFAVPVIVPIFEPLWKGFDMLIGVIQAYIFMLLTILYFGMAMSHDESHEQRHAESPALVAA